MTDEEILGTCRKCHISCFECPLSVEDYDKAQDLREIKVTSDMSRAELTKARKRDQYLKHRDEQRERAKKKLEKNHAEHLERRRAWYTEHKDEINARRRKKRAENPEKYLEQYRAYRQEHKDELREKEKAYRKAHEEEVKAKDRERHRRLREERAKKARETA